MIAQRHHYERDVSEDVGRLADTHASAVEAHLAALINVVGDDRAGEFICGLADNFRPPTPLEPVETETPFLKCFRAHGPYPSVTQHIRRGVAR